MVTTASHHTAFCHVSIDSPSEWTMMRINAANAAALTAAAMNAVMGVGAPSYTSGVHMWNGTAPTLNANPMISNPMPAISMPLDCSPRSVILMAMRVRLVVPVAP